MLPSTGNCAKCHQSNLYTKVVCDFCGARLPWADAVQKPASTPPTSQTPAPKPGKTPKIPQWLWNTAPPSPFPNTLPSQFPASPPQGAPAPPTQSSSVLPAGIPPLPLHGQICERCGFVGHPTNYTQGSFLVELALWLMFCAPGLIYSLWRLTSRKSCCPRCQGAMLPLQSPGGAALFSRFYQGQ